MPSKIQKRYGQVVAFKPGKIAAAIGKAFAAVGEEDGEVAGRLAEAVVGVLDARVKGVPSVEVVQDIVEEILIKDGYAKVAKAYILYRQKRAELREAKKFLGVIDDLKLG
ncbi:MAG: ATP cone domain-containing protein, partial [Candidatus Hydrothermarchaeota archaeon]|nr:ATP cone domain-containing protein [Candidatus Hydrothermarchaeota archaeon]